MKKKIVWIILAVLIAAAIIYKIKSGGQAISVEVESVKKGDIDSYIEETAVVKLENEKAVYSKSSGRILQVLVDVGDSVKAGAVLAKLDSEDIKLQIKSLELKKQALLAEYEEATKEANPAEIQKLQALIKSAEVTYDSAKRTADNSKKLYEAGAISAEEYQNALTNLASSEANLDSAKSSLALAQQGVSEAVKKQYESQIAELQLQIDDTEKSLSDITIKAPISGTIMSSEIEAGNVIQPGLLLFQIGEEGHLYLESDLLVSDIGNVKVGSPVIIRNTDLGILDAKGTVRKIHPKAFSKLSELGIEQKRIKIEIDLDSPISQLKPEFDVDIKVITESKKDVLMISEKAIFEYNGKDHVFIYDNGIAKLKEIETGIESDKEIEVLSGLKAGDKVIISPDTDLKDGAKVEIASSSLSN